MNRRILITIMLVSVVIIIWLIARSNSQSKLFAPGYSQTLGEQVPEPTPAPPVAPKTFELDAATDLEAELEKINPEVLDNDFE